jgi:KDO2-lipid IV(A) lauroyltransferase
MTPLRRLEYLAEYSAARLFILGAQSLPLPSALRLGEWAGRRMVSWTRRSFRTAVDNLLQAYPGMPQAEAEAMARRVYEHFGRATVEMAVADRLLTRSTYRDHVVLRNEAVLRDVLAAGKGAIFVAAHLGPWEILGVMAPHLGIRLNTVYRPVKNPHIDRFMRRYRAAHGQTIIPKYGALPTLLRVLRRGGYIALLVDQHARDGGLWVPFFGRPAATTPAPALLALRTGAPILTSYARRLPGLYRFEMFCDEPIFVRPTGDRAADVRRATVEISRRLEQYVRQSPEQWLWPHRRWRTPPEGVIESPLYKGRAGS